MSLGTIKSYPGNPRVAKAQIAAAYNGLKFDVKTIDLAKDRTAEYYAKFPLGKVPVFESKEVNLFESSAIGYYAAAQKENSPLLGTTPVEKALIVQYVLFAENELHSHSSQWTLPLLGIWPYVKPSVETGEKNLKRALAALDKILLDKTYLVGEQVTYADIAVTCALVTPFRLVLDKAAREEYKNVTRYFKTLVGKEHFKAALGEVQLCETTLKYSAPKKEKKEAAPAKKEEQKKKKEPAAAAEEEAPKPPPKPKSKLDLLPPSKFVMDEWKRMYSNNNTDVAMKWFWEHHDPEGYSLWRVDYKYNDELTLVFMSCNLIGGFFARLEMARKYAFGSLVVCGENNNNTISGYFLIRGQEVPFEVYDAADYDSYTFTKIEPAQYEEKKDEIYKYFAWEVEGFQDGKIFK
ncbi:Elongation factor 1-gamma [Apophysomyces ossiformis]|uniref:Elongation factor 1-gamma n=1 Tax=Apophysomyces ossiformis TaxID=679940 RepID=A0A8H7EKU0_9FUNG|nr:Elongation factor 1-gamma [Apophysomyces ossiformis]